MEKSLRVAYGEALVELGGENENIVVLDADLAHATMTSMFAEKYPDRFFNFGIAESNMVCSAAGFAHSGFTPFVSTFALFGAGRAFEEVRNSVCYVNADVKFAFSHSGLCVGEDGGSHQAIEDLALMRVLPNMTILVPCDPVEMKKAVHAAANIKGPVYIRIARPVCRQITENDAPFVPGKANVLRSGKDVCIISCGLMVPVALEAAEMLKEQGIEATVVNMHTIKPIDRACIEEMSSKCRGIVTVEEHSVIGGLGSAVAEVLSSIGGVKQAMVGIEDKFGRSGKPGDLFNAYGLTAENVASKCRGVLGI